MSHPSPSRLSLALLAAGLACSSAATADEQFSSLFTDAKPIFDLRYRYEHVDQDNSLSNANAQTLRTRFGLQSGSWYGFSGLIEVDNVSRLGDAAYNSTRNGQSDHSTVVDPDGSEVNQALLRYDHTLGSAVVGRQRINLDNQRFVGGVGWRQNEQTYDGMLGQLKPFDGLTLTYAYIDNINTIFGPDDNRYDNRSNPANIEGHSHLINAQYVLARADGHRLQLSAGARQHCQQRRGGFRHPLQQDPRRAPQRQPLGYQLCPGIRTAARLRRQPTGAEQRVLPGRTGLHPSGRGTQRRNGDPGR